MDAHDFEAKNLATIFRKDTNKQVEAKDLITITNAESPHASAQVVEKQKKAVNFITTFSTTDLDDTMTADDFSHKDMNSELEKKFEKTTDNGEANSGHVMPRLQEPSSEKVGTAGLIKKLVNNVKTNDGHIAT